MYYSFLIIIIYSFFRDASKEVDHLLPKCFTVLKEYCYENGFDTFSSVLRHEQLNWASYRICHLCVSEANSRELVDMDVIALVVQQMRRYQQNTDVFVHACGLLVNLSVQSMRLFSSTCLFIYFL